MLLFGTCLIQIVIEMIQRQIMLRANGCSIFKQISILSREEVDVPSNFEFQTFTEERLAIKVSSADEILRL